MSQVSPVAARIAALQQAGSAMALLEATQELASCADASAAGASSSAANSPQGPKPTMIGRSFRCAGACATV